MKRTAWLEIHPESDIVRLNVQETVDIVGGETRTLPGTDQTLSLSLLPSGVKAQLRAAIAAMTEHVNAAPLDVDPIAAVAALESSLGQKVVLGSVFDTAATVAEGARAELQAELDATKKALADALAARDQLVTEAAAAAEPSS